MKPKKQNLKFIIGICTLIYAALMLFCLHYSAYKALFPKGTFMELFDVTLTGIQSHPLSLVHAPTGFATTAIFITLAYGLAIFYLIADSQRNKHIREDIANGSAKWNVEEDKYNKVYSSPPAKKEYNGETNMIMTHTIRLNMDTRKTRRNCNMVVIGGSGSGKSRFLVKPNLCEMPLNCSFVVTDPSGEMIQSTGKMLSDAGYKIKCFNLVNMQASNCYNPLKYIKTEDDIIVLVDCILKNTSDPNKTGGDDFWEKAQQMMLNAFIGALWKYGGKKDPNDPDDRHGTFTFNGNNNVPQTLLSVMDLMRCCTVEENPKAGSTTKTNPTDEAFNKLRVDLKEKFGLDNDFCLKQYDGFKMGAGKTLKSILISAIARLSAFDVEGLRRLTCTDNIELDKIGDEKTALFIILPTAQGTFNFVSSMMYSQLFQSLYYHAEKECLGNYVVYDSSGEAVKIFPIPHFEEEYVDNDAEAEEIELDEVVITKKSKAKKLAKNALKNKNKAIQMSEEDQMNASVEENYNEDAINEKVKDSLSALNATSAQLKEQGIAEAKKAANDFISAAKKVKVLKKGSKYITKVDDEIIGWYGSEKFARTHAERLKNCTVKALGLRLPFHVRLMMDEFANIGEIPDFTQKLSTMRKYEISCTIILQSLSQIKKMYEKDWGTILGNCDSLLFLGCPEYETQEYISKRLGKATVKVRNTSVSKGSKGGHSLSYNLTARDLMTPEEVGLMGDQECLYFLRGIDPFRVPKFKYETHPNYQYTGDASFDNIYNFRPPALSQEEKDIISDSSQMIYSPTLATNTSTTPPLARKTSLASSSDDNYVNTFNNQNQSSSGFNVGPATSANVVESANISGSDIINNKSERRSNSTNTVHNTSRISKSYSSLSHNSDPSFYQREDEKRIAMINGSTNDKQESEKVFKEMNEHEIFSSAIALQESLVLNTFFDDDDDDDIIEENLFTSSKPTTSSNT